MKQTRSLSEFSCLSEYTRLYLNINPDPSSRSVDIGCTLVKINGQLTQFWNILPFFSLNMTNMSQINHVQDSLIFIVAEIFCSGCFRLDEYQIKDDNRIKLPVFNKLPKQSSTLSTSTAVYNHLSCSVNSKGWLAQKRVFDSY